MKKTIQKLVFTSLLAASVIGCGSSFEEVSTVGSSTAPTTASRLQNAFLDNPRPGLETVPTAHLDPLSRFQANGTNNSNVLGQSTAPPIIISVADLESDYETIFCSLNQSLGVTKESPENVNNINYIKEQSGTGFFDLNAQPILNNPLGVTGVSFQPLNYDTTVPLPGGEQTFQVSGGLLMPVGISADQVKGVIVYFHGTTFDKSQVGSNYDGSIETQLNAQVFASQGYIVAIPDYVGQGVDWQNVHPYVLYPEVSAQTAVDMLSAIKPLVFDQYGFSDSDPPLKLFSTGYSEGGSYSLWFNTYVTANPAGLDPFYNLTHSVGMEGAYSTSQVTFGYLFDDVSKSDNTYNIQNLLLVNFVKPILSADAFLSYATYSESSNFGNVFNLDFFNMLATSPIPPEATQVNGQSVDIAEAFAQPSTQIAPALALSGFGKSANGATYPSITKLNSVLFSSKNGIGPLVSANILLPEPLSELTGVLEEADADLSNLGDGAVSIVTLDMDSVVPPNNFDLLLANYPTKIDNAYRVDHSQLLVVSPYSSVLGSAQWVPIDHLNGPPYEYLYALNIFNQY
jgi:hypothetical protein